MVDPDSPAGREAMGRTEIGREPRGPAGSLPEDIAARAGLPRQEEIAHSLHAVTDHPEQPREAALAAARARAETVHRETGQGQGSGEREIGESAEILAREAANAGLDLRSRAADAAEAARERVGEGIERVREGVRDGVERVRGRAAEQYEEARTWAADRYDAHSRRAFDMADRGYVRLRRGRTATETFVSENPLLVGVVGVAAGLLLGALLPNTRRENETLGPWADEARDQGLRYAREMTHRGRAFVETALDPDNLDRAARKAGLEPEAGEAGHREGEHREERYEGAERTAHRL